MGKLKIIGNGQILVGLDKFGQVKDFYFPKLDHENQIPVDFVHKIGVYVNNSMHWFDESWNVIFDYKYDSRDSKIKLINNEIKIEIEFRDEVYNEKNILLREVTIRSKSEEQRNIKVFFNQQFLIYESLRGDTAYYNPDCNAIIHYEGRRNFLINAYIRETKKMFDQFTIDAASYDQKPIAYLDAEDGILKGKAIDHGLVDSVIGFDLLLNTNEDSVIDYWITAAKEIKETIELNDYVLKKTPEYLINSTHNYWKAWINKNEPNFVDLGEKVKWLFGRSLETLRLNIDKEGGIVASIDGDLLKYGKDTYAYVWPRDAAFTWISLAKAGYNDNKEIFKYFNRVISNEGYFVQKYRTDGSIGSSWHSWIQEGTKIYPIQLDETALVLIALWEEYLQERDIEFIEDLYNSLIVKAINFLISRIDETTGLIKPSYDLWEEKFGSFTFTACTIYGALEAAANFAKVFGKNDKAEEYLYWKERVKYGIMTYLYSQESKLFYKGVNFKEGSIVETLVIDKTVDSSSLYGIYRFGILDANDSKVKDFQKITVERLYNNIIGGIPRYENDNYFRNEASEVGNPWVITTLWMAQLEVRQATTLEELNKTKRYFDWILEIGLKSGVLPEQVNPSTGEHLSATPLTWSHAEFIITVLDYSAKYKELTSG